MKQHWCYHCKAFKDAKMVHFDYGMHESHLCETCGQMLGFEDNPMSRKYLKELSGEIPMSEECKNLLKLRR